MLWAGSSYSESISPYYGQTGNAAGQGLTWSMGNALPSGIPGLDINGVIYRYTINKNVNDSVGVEIRNQNANGVGYIFRERDDWLPGSLGGTQINKIVPVVPSNRSLWGDGEIAVDGQGSVSDPSVVYTYKVDPCYDPQFDPNCPGFQVTIPDVYEVDLTTLYDPMQDVDVTLETCKQGNSSPQCEAILADANEEETKTEEELAKEEEEEKEDREMRLEKALAAADNSALFATSLAQSQLLDSVNSATNMNSYYAKSLVGGTYNENVSLVDSKLPENKRGLRNGFAQQILHNEMVGMQYK